MPSCARTAYLSCCALALTWPVRTPATQGLPAESLAFQAIQLRSPDLRPAERLSNYVARDFAPLWTHTDAEAVVGFIGPHYQRLEVKVLTATRSSADPAQYVLTGKTRVAGVVRAFSGTLRLLHLRVAFPRPRLGEGDDRLPAGAREGMVVGQYALAESKDLAKTGVFQGVVVTHWYVDGRGHLHYNDADLSTSDSFANNQFVGTWTGYTTGRALRCNWGDYRVPNAGPLDIGAGEFSPAAKYAPYGWQAYNTAGTAEARSPQSASWWK